MARLNYIDAVEAIANESWGRDVDDTDALKSEYANCPEKLAAYGILAILKRITAPISDGYKPPPEDYKRHGDAGVYPEAKVGDVFYCGCIDEGFTEFVVLGKNSDGHCRIAECPERDGTYPYRHHIKWAIEGLHFTSLSLALEHSAREDVEYYGPKTKIAREALAAVQAGEDLSKYTNYYKRFEE